MFVATKFPDLGMNSCSDDCAGIVTKVIYIENLDIFFIFYASRNEKNCPTCYETINSENNFISKLMW